MQHQEASIKRQEHRELELIMGKLCVITLTLAAVGVALQLILGGVLFFILAAIASVCGFLSGYYWHKNKEKNRKLL